MEKKENCEHKNIEFFDGLQEEKRVRFWFCLDCDEEIEFEPDYQF